MFEGECQAFQTLLATHSGIGSLPAARRELLVRFYEKVLQENVTQNLTRLLSPQAFFEGHVLDAWELESFGVDRGLKMDLGTGVGSPGLIHAILFGSSWVLCDSEKNKAAFLGRVVAELGISGVEVTNQRAEAYLVNHQVPVVVSKAVGKAEKIYGWLHACSTWNQLVLLKGPAWTEEWAEFGRSRWKKELRLLRAHEYQVGTPPISRKLIQLERVPRGTAHKR